MLRSKATLFYELNPKHLKLDFMKINLLIRSNECREPPRNR